MRPDCVRCVRKHVGSALVLLPELFLGYPDHIIYVVGELDQAAQEALGYDYALSKTLRDFRLGVESAYDDFVARGLTPDAAMQAIPDHKDIVAAINAAVLLESKTEAILEMDGN